jgi:hypothetical protein
MAAGNAIDHLAPKPNPPILPGSERRWARIVAKTATVEMVGSGRFFPERLSRRGDRPAVHRSPMPFIGPTST